MEGEKVLVYPFEYQEGTIDDDTLKKLEWDTKDDVCFQDAHESRQVAIYGVKGGVKVRRKFEKGIEIRQTDVERLRPGVWLNDTLIDFWCLWETRSDLSFEVHCFNSFFFTILEEQGASGVESWTVHRDLNVFSKKMIFVPIGRNSHWSLCVVVNRIWGEGVRGRLPGPTSIVYFLDSKKGLHDGKLITSSVVDWLRSEWRRTAEEEKVGSGGSGEMTDTFHVCVPTVPQQTNTADCGVFVCKYVSSLYSLRRHTFSIENAAKIIEKGGAFDFDESDVALLRYNMNEVITLLSGVYQRSMAVERRDCVYGSAIM